MSVARALLLAAFLAASARGPEPAGALTPGQADAGAEASPSGGEGGADAGPAAGHAEADAGPAVRDGGQPGAPAGPSHGLTLALFPAYRDAGDKPKDGSLVDDYAGPGDAQLKISQDYLRQRDALLGQAEAPLAALLAVAKELDAAQSSEQRAVIRQRLSELSGAPLDGAHKKLAEALKLEDRRVFMVRKALELARERGHAIPGVDPVLVQQFYLGITSNLAGKVADRRIQAYRNLVTGILAFLDDDMLTALARIKAVTEDAPDLALAHVYLGSISFLVQQPEQAVASWKKALELDPSNEAVRKALRDYSAAAKGIR